MTRRSGGGTTEEVGRQRGGADVAEFGAAAGVAKLGAAAHVAKLGAAAGPGGRDGAPSRDPGSFRDPNGFVYRRAGVVHRQVNRAYAANWEQLHGSGLYAELTERGWLVPHDEAPLENAFDRQAWRVIRPLEVDLISYPYEWTFSQLRDAALLTLSIQTAALRRGMSLKDASAYNVQFHDGRPVLIDALSFERAEADAPWVAYRQFCQHFLAPLALMAQRDVRLGLLLRDFIDGLPLDLAAQLLPATSRLRLGLATHLHLHARAQRRHSNDGQGIHRPTLSPGRLEALLDSLRATVEGLHWQPSGTEWADYGETTSYSARAAASKARLVAAMLGRTEGRWVWDLGANTGVFTQLAVQLGRRVVALDGDAGAAERHYRRLRESGATDVLPLVVDLTNPSPSLGWASSERRSLVDRAHGEVLLALALVHHLAIGNNVPLPMIAELFAGLGRELVVEFVPKTDPRVAAMLASRQDIFPDYSLDGFRRAFAGRWQMVEQAAVEDSERVLFRCRRRGDDTR